jgi:predicted RNase H-like nuclease
MSPMLKAAYENERHWERCLRDAMGKRHLGVAYIPRREALGYRRGYARTCVKRIREWRAIIDAS